MYHNDVFSCCGRIRIHSGVVRMRRQGSAWATVAGVRVREDGGGDALQRGRRRGCALEGAAAGVRAGGGGGGVRARGGAAM